MIMPEDQTPVEQAENIPDPEEAKLEAKRKRARRWQWYGWGVIGMMILIILLNLFEWVSLEFNKYSMIAVVVAYGVYVVFRKR